MDASHRAKGQPEHHRKVSYRNELNTLLTRAGLEYDESYLD
jgi:hypothetical protein